MFLYGKDVSFVMQMLIYLDYQKAFDTVPHKRLISKLYAYNIDEKIINWIKYYLSERKQYVEINREKSEWQKGYERHTSGKRIGTFIVSNIYKRPT